MYFVDDGGFLFFSFLVLASIDVPCFENDGNHVCISCTPRLSLGKAKGLDSNLSVGSMQPANDSLVLVMVQWTRLAGRSLSIDLLIFFSLSLSLSTRASTVVLISRNIVRIPSN